MYSTVNNIPKITVLMPVYNCELYIKEAIDSILNQTFSDFEFIIIDDASTDATVTLIKTYDDHRIKLIEKERNSGLTISLNHGLSIAKGEYIARMDGDDISLSERFAKQISYLDDNPDVVLCGTNYSIIGLEKVVTLPQENEMIKMSLLKGNCIAHPSVMIRNHELQKFKIFYDSKTEPAEDYDLWVRLLSIGKLRNLQEVLLNYRVHNAQVSQKRELDQINSGLESRLKMFNYLNYHFNDKEYVLLKKIMNESLSVPFAEIENFSILIKKMVLADSNNFFDPNCFQQYLFELQKQNLLKYFIGRQKYNPIICFQYFAIRNKYKFKLKLLEELKLIVKSIIFFRRM